MIAVCPAPAPAVTTDYQTWGWGEFEGGYRFDVAYGNSRFVATGRVSNVEISADGLNWEIGRDGSDTEGWFRSMVFANGRFITLGDNGFFFSSANGLDWTSHTPDDTTSIGAFFDERYIGLKMAEQEEISLGG